MWANDTHQIGHEATTCETAARLSLGKIWTIGLGAAYSFSSSLILFLIHAR